MNPGIGLEVWHKPNQLAHTAACPYEYKFGNKPQVSQKMEPNKCRKEA
jgi:hypothetical protein